MVTTELLGNIRGNPGVQGPQGLRGFPGAADVPTDPALAAILGADDSETFAVAQVSMRNITNQIFSGYMISERWRAAVERVLSGTGPAKVLCIGDSTTWGTGSSGSYANLFSYPSELARNMHRSIATTTYGLSIPPSDNQPASDPRWVLGSGWAQATEASVGLGGRRTAYKGTPGGVGALQFVDGRVTVDRYDIYYTDNPSSSAAGTFTANAGGADLVVNTLSGGTPGVIRKATVSGPSSSTIGVTIRNTGATGNVWIVGIEPWASAAKSFRVGNAGVAASGAPGWTPGPTANNWGVESFLTAYVPDMTIIDLGINDAPALSVADFLVRMQALADKAYAVGSAVMFKTMIPSEQTDKAAREAEYVNALKTQMSPRYAVLDLFNHYGTWARNNARGWMLDWGHGTDPMYADEGALVAEFLFRYSGHNG